MKSYDEWCAAWSKRAALHEEIGREALARNTFEPPANACNGPPCTTISRRFCFARHGADEGRA